MAHPTDTTLTTATTMKPPPFDPSGSAKLSVNYYTATLDEWNDDNSSYHDYSPLELKLIWTLTLNSMKSGPLKSATESKRAVDFWIDARDPSVDFLDDLIWNLLFKSKDSPLCYATVLKYVLEKIQSSHIIPSFDRTNKTPLAKAIKQWLIDSSLASQSTTTTLETICESFILNNQETIATLALTSLHSSLLSSLQNHPSSSLTPSDLKKHLTPTQESLLHLFHLSTLQSLLHDYVVGIPTQTLTSLLRLYDAGSVMEADMPRFDHRVVHAVCASLDPDFWSMELNGQILAFLREEGGWECWVGALETRTVN